MNQTPRPRPFRTLAILAAPLTLTSLACLALVGCRGSSGPEDVVRGKLEAKYGKDLARTVVTRLRGDAARKKTDVGKEQFWSAALKSVGSDPASLLTAEETKAVADQAEVTKRQTHASKARTYPGDLLSILRLTPAQAKAAFTPYPGAKSKAGGFSGIAKMKESLLVYVDYNPEFDRAYKTRPSSITVFSLSPDRPMEIGAKGLKRVGLDPKLLKLPADFEEKTDAKKWAKSGRYRGVPKYGFRPYEDSLSIWSDTDHSP